MSYNLSEIQKLKIAVSKRRTGLEQMKSRHADELRMKELELRAAEFDLFVAMNDITGEGQE
jgi:hypothetical protein